jgi:phenylacetate-CoA ligase
MQTETSGSTGEPVKVRGTDLDLLLWEAMTLREHAWHRREFSGKLAVIRATAGSEGAPPHGTALEDWGPPVSTVFRTGPCAMLSLATDISVQAAWLGRHAPDYLVTYPSNLAALIARLARAGERPPGLRSVKTIGETVTPALRAACRDSWNVPIFDSYSSQELGYVASQCGESELYHVMAESALVEVIGAGGRPCAPGETGRLVITRLHDFATPLIRYDLGDYAEAGGPCPCGRGLPTLARILGRSRNLVTLPTGERHWPLVGFARYRELAPVRQYQLVQHAADAIEVRLVVERALTAAEEGSLAGVIREALGYPFRLAFVYYENEIPRGPGGKFEEFISQVGA